MNNEKPLSGEKGLLEQMEETLKLTEEEMKECDKCKMLQKSKKADACAYHTFEINSLNSEIKGFKNAISEARKQAEANIDEIANQNAGQLAEWLHATYEEISKTVGWKTQESCQTKFKDLPEKNRSVMLRVAQRIQVEKLVPLVVENINLKKQLKEAEVEKYSKVMQ